MKKNLLIATIVMLSLATSDDVFAQFSKVGATALTDNGVWDWTFNSATGSGFRAIRGRSNTTGTQNTGLEIYSSYNGDDGASLFMFSNAAATNKGATEIWSSNTTTTGHAFAVVHHPNASTWTGLFTVHNDGKVSIGNVNKNTSSPYKLYVETGILTEKLKVAIATSTDWSDFVFANDYNLKPLSEVESFINKNKHLPDVPSASDMVTNGLDVAKMDAKLLQKIEELTLYVIEQQKEINTLKKKISNR